MRAAILDRIEPQLPSGLPLRSVQLCSRHAGAARLLALIPAMVALAFASTHFMVQTAAAPAARAIVAQKPVLALEIAATLAFWAYLLGLPLKRLLVRLAIRRTVEIDNATVTVREGKNLRTYTWTEPLSAFAGITHHVRASLSGTRHELILIHPDRDKSVLVGVCERMLREDIERVAKLLGHPLIHPKELYRRSSIWPRVLLHHLWSPAHV